MGQNWPYLYSQLRLAMGLSRVLSTNSTLGTLCLPVARDQSSLVESYCLPPPGGAWEYRWPGISPAQHFQKDDQVWGGPALGHRHSQGRVGQRRDIQLFVVHEHLRSGSAPAFYS